jgi:DNA-binding NarL/FixJ family response regulator
MAVSVLIVDDEPGFRANARRLLALRGFSVAGEAGDASEALQLARSRRPGAVLLDVNIPDASGIEVARELASLSSPPRVLLISADAEVCDQLVRECGAHAFVPKLDLLTCDLAALLGLAEPER